MPVTTIVFVAAVVIAFTLFGAALAWGAHQTRTLPLEERKPEE
ncbi:MAG: hypothetical protein ABI697_01615 [Devosia sp.]